MGGAPLGGGTGVFWHNLADGADAVDTLHVATPVERLDYFASALWHELKAQDRDAFLAAAGWIFRQIDPNTPTEEQIRQLFRWWEESAEARAVQSVIQNLGEPSVDLVAESVEFAEALRTSGGVDVETAKSRSGLAVYYLGAGLGGSGVGALLAKGAPTSAVVLALLAVITGMVQLYDRL